MSRPKGGAVSQGTTSAARVQAPARRGGFHYAYLIVAAGIVIAGIPCALVLSCAGIFFTPVSEYFGVARASFTMYFSILNLAMMFMLPVAGKLISRFDTRAVLSAAVALDGIALVAMSRFTAVWMFYIAGVALGIGTAPLIYLAVPTLINAWCKKKVGFFVGLCMAFTGIGGVVFNPLGTALISSGAEGWRMGYLVFGLIVLIVALPFTFLVVRSKPADKGLLPYGAEDAASEDGDAAKGAAAASTEQDVMAAQAMRMPAFFALVVFSFVITVNQTVYQFLPSYCLSFADSIPSIAAISGVVASACMAGQAIGKVVLGVVNDKSAKLGLSLGVGCGLVGVALMALVPGISAALLVGAFAFGFVYACTTVQTPLLVRSAFGSLDYTNIYSRVSIAGALGGVVASIFWGFVTDLPGGFVLMFGLSVVCMVLCFILGMLALRRN